MADLHKIHRRKLRPGYSWEFNGKGIKPLNRKIVRKRIKEEDRRNEQI